MNGPIRLVVCEDEPLVRERILALVSAHGGFEVVGTASDGLDALDVIKATEPDVLLLDIQMPELDGFQVIQALDAPLPVIGIVTAFDQYAIRAFELHAIDYVLKPFDIERFALMLIRLSERVRLREANNDGRLAELLSAHFTPLAALRRLAVPDGDRTLLLDVAEIAWIDADDDYVRVHTAKREWRVRERLSGLAQKLSPEQFVRIHRSTVVNLAWIAELQPWSHGEMIVVLRQGQRLHVSRTYGSALRRLVNNIP